MADRVVTGAARRKFHVLIFGNPNLAVAVNFHAFNILHGAIAAEKISMPQIYETTVR